MWEWTARGAAGYGEMTNLPLALRGGLAEQVPFSSSTWPRGRVEGRHGEGALPTDDRQPVEAVLMRYRDGRRTVCVSSQSGCPLTCTFCATGAMRSAAT